MYRNGKGVKQDYSAVMEWYMKAANQGHSSAQYSIDVKIHCTEEFIYQDDDLA